MAVAKTVAKIPAKIAAPSKVVNQTAKTVKDDAGTLKLAPKSTPVVAKPSVSAPLKAGSAPVAAPKPVQTSTVPQGLKPTDLTTLIQQNLNKPQLQPIGSNTPIVHSYQTGQSAQAELAKAQAAHQALMDSIKLKEQQAAAAKAAQAKAAALAPKPQPVVQPAPQPAPVVQQPAPVVQQPAPQPVMQPSPQLVPGPVPGPVSPEVSVGGINLLQQNPGIVIGLQTPGVPTPVVPTPTPTPAPALNYKLPTGWSFNKAPVVAAPKV
jgi:hypothetical protein